MACDYTGPLYREGLDRHAHYRVGGAVACDYTGPLYMRGTRQACPL